MKKVSLAFIIAAALFTPTAGADRISVHGASFSFLPSAGVGYQWGDTDTGAVRASVNGLVFPPTFLPEVQLDYLRSLGVGSHFYGGAGVGTIPISKLNLQGRAFIGAQTRGQGLRFYAEGGGVVSTVPFSGSRLPDGTTHQEHFAPYAKIGVTFPLR
ncbi:MAG: hypothetical protein Q4C67_05970 [Deinococcus sp.]|nr:hypothetical protein [Deinococcus sp.]